MNVIVGPKKIWTPLVAFAVLFGLLWAGYKLASNQRLVNKLNPVWEVQGQVVSENGAPILDVKLNISFSIGYYPIGRVLEQSAEVEHEIVTPDTNGFFNIRRRCDAIFIKVDNARYKIVDSQTETDQVVFSKLLRSAHTMSDRNFKLVLKLTPPN